MFLNKHILQKKYTQTKQIDTNFIQISKWDENRKYSLHLFSNEKKMAVISTADRIENSLNVICKINV